MTAVVLRFVIDNTFIVFSVCFFFLTDAVVVNSDNEREVAFINLSVRLAAFGLPV